MSEPLWISEGIAKAIHADQITQHGGIQGIRDEKPQLLEILKHPLRRL